MIQFLQFEGDAVFQNNENFGGVYQFDGGALSNSGGSGNGAGLYNEGGSVHFKGASSFIGNTVSELKCDEYNNEM